MKFINIIRDAGGESICYKLTDKQVIRLIYRNVDDRKWDKMAQLVKQATKKRAAGNYKASNALYREAETVISEHQDGEPDIIVGVI